MDDGRWRDRLSSVVSFNQQRTSATLYSVAFRSPIPWRTMYYWRAPASLPRAGICTQASLAGANHRLRPIGHWSLPKIFETWFCTVLTLSANCSAISVIAAALRDQTHNFILAIDTTREGRC